jgi:branched-subunit amino acid aminotransferase/4-amino-4-deoxychorismate lyase
MYAFVNGALVETAKATIPIGDRGFRFGDGIFETIPVYEGLPYLWEAHLARMTGGLAALHMDCNTDTLLNQALKLLKANTLHRGLLRIQISRGEGSRGYLPTGSIPTVIIETLAAPAAPLEPVSLRLSSLRKISPNALPTHFKLAQGLSSTLARMEAAEHGAYDALLLSETGHVSETSSANIFWRTNGRLYTPSLDTGALAGVTRQRIIDRFFGPVEEGRFTLESLQNAEAVVLTNAGLGAIAACEVVSAAAFAHSTSLADEINAMRNSDIAQYIAQLRESLATA